MKPGNAIATQPPPGATSASSYDVMPGSPPIVANQARDQRDRANPDAQLAGHAWHEGVRVMTPTRRPTALAATQQDQVGAARPGDFTPLQSWRVPSGWGRQGGQRTSVGKERLQGFRKVADE